MAHEPRGTRTANTVVIVVNAVAAGLAAVYGATQSTVVTAIAAVLIAVLGLGVLAHHRQGPDR